MLLGRRPSLWAAFCCLLCWIDEGAAIYVCGSLQGMASVVDAVLRAVLGSEQVDALQEAGRYRRDLY
jgi:sulfite reductase (NADPH) flavoprotein alpha-component